jgi:hypothetical protein
MRRWAAQVWSLLRRDACLKAAADWQARYGVRIHSGPGGIPIASPGTTLDLSTRPPLGEAGVVAFEQKWGVRLPEPYRTYVRDVADGGAGPGYGVFPLGMRDESVIGDDIGESDLPLLAEPFNATTAFSLELADVDEEDDDAVEKAFADYCDPRWTAGAMFLNHYGCALRALIVMNGPWAGRVIVDERADTGGIVPFDGAAARRYHRDDGIEAIGEPIPFDTWYESWLRTYRAKLETVT